MAALIQSLGSLKAWQFGFLAAVLLAAAGGTYGIYAWTSNDEKTGLAEGQQLIPVQRGDLINQVSTNGSLVFANRETLFFGSQGTVAEVLVEEGQPVALGQELAGLDGATVASLVRSVAQAQLNLRDAEEALDQANNPHSPLQLAQAEAKVANARLSLQTAEEALASLLEPTPKDLAQTEAAVTSARLSVDQARDALDTLLEGVSVEELDAARVQLDSANTGLLNAQTDLKLARRDWDARVLEAQEAVDVAQEDYSGVFQKWLGTGLSGLEVAQEPHLLLASLRVDIEALFDPNQRSQDIILGPAAVGPPTDDPDTAWSELVVYLWNETYPGSILPTCDEVDLAAGDLCVLLEIEDAWDVYQIASDDLDTINNQAAKGLASAEDALNRTEDTLASAQDGLEALLEEADPLDVENREKQLVLALETLSETEEALATLLGAPNPVAAEAKRQQVAVAQASFDEAEEELGELLTSIDPTEVALREAEVNSAILALESAVESLEGATLYSPMDGFVAQVNIDAGQEVNPRTAVVEVVDPTVVELNAIVDEIDVLFVRLGASAEVIMDALPGQVLQGSVSSIAAAAQSQQGVVSYPITIRLDVIEGVELVEGLSATANIVIREDLNVLLVPNQAIYGTFELPLVQVFSNGGVEPRAVILGNSDDFWTVVSQGLLEGEQVVMEVQQASTTGFGPGGLFRQFGGIPGGGFGGRGFGGGGQQQQRQDR